MAASSKRLKQLVSRQIAASVSRHDNSGSEARAVAGSVPRCGAVDMSCQRVTCDVVQLLIATVAAAEPPISEISLQCAKIDDKSLEMLMSLVESTPSIECVISDGSDAPVGWVRRIQEICATNTQRNREAEIQRVHTKARKSAELAQKQLDIQIPKINRAHCNGVIAINKDEARERRQLRSQWRSIPLIAQEGQRRRQNLETLLRAVAALVELQQGHRQALASLQQQQILALLECSEADQRKIALDRCEALQRAVLWRESCRSYELHRQRERLRLSLEHVARAGVEVEAVRSRSAICDEERASFLAICGASEEEVASQHAAIREARQREEEEKRRHRLKADEESRTTAYKLERHRLDVAQRRAQQVASRGKLLSAEESRRAAISNAESSIIHLLTEVLSESTKLIQAQHSVKLLERKLADWMRMEPIPYVASSVSHHAPLFLFEQSDKWICLDRALCVELRMPVAWEQRVELIRAELRAATARFHALFVGRQKRIRSLWIQISELAKRLKVGLAYFTQAQSTMISGKSADPLDASIVTGSLPASPLRRDEGSSRAQDAAAQGCAALFPSIFGGNGEENGEDDAGIPAALVAAERTRITRAVMALQLVDESRQPLHDEEDRGEHIRLSGVLTPGLLRSKQPSLTRLELTLQGDHVGAAVAQGALAAALHSVEVATRSRNFGAIRHVAVSIDGTVNGLGFAAVLPICVCESLVAAHCNDYVAEGSAEVALGVPWIVREFPVVAFTGCGGDCGDGVCSSGSEQAQDTLPKLIIDAKIAKSVGVKHIGFAGCTIELELSPSGSCADADRLYIPSSGGDSVKVILGVVSVDGAMVAKVEEGSLVSSTPAHRRHVVRFVQHTEIRREVVMKFLNSLRFSCLTSVPGRREISVRISPPSRVGPRVMLTVDVKAVDPPVQLLLNSSCCVFRTKCPSDLPAALRTLVALSSTPVAPHAEIVFPEVDVVCGGFLRVSISDGRMPGDHLWIKNTDGRGCGGEESALHHRGGIVVQPLRSSEQPFSPPLRGVPRDGRCGVALVWYSGCVVGQLSVQKDASSSSSLPNVSPRLDSESISGDMDSHSVGRSVLPKGAEPDPSDMKKVGGSLPPSANNSPPPSSLENADCLLVTFVEDTRVPLVGVREVLRCICFTNTQAHPPCGRRAITVEMELQRASGSCGGFEENCDAALQTVSNLITETIPLVVTPAAIRAATRTAELSYTEDSGEQRIIPIEVLGEHESYTRLWRGFVRLSIDSATLFDRVVVRALEKDILFGRLSGSVKVVKADSIAAELRATLDRIPRQMLSDTEAYPSPAAASRSRRASLVLDVSPELASISNSPFPNGSSSKAVSPPHSPDVVQSIPERFPTEEAPQNQPLRHLTGDVAGINTSAEERGESERESSPSGNGQQAPPVLQYLPYGEADPHADASFFASVHEAMTVLEEATAVNNKGVTRQFKDFAHQVEAFCFVQDDVTFAAAYTIPGCVAISWDGAVGRQRISYILRSLTYECLEQQPLNLHRTGRVAFFDGSCLSSVLFPIRICPIDDPLEIINHQPAVKFRIGSTGVDHFSDSEFRDHVDGFRSSLHVHPSPAAAVSDELRLLTGVFVPLLWPGSLELRDQRSLFWDRGGSIVVDVVSGGMRGEGVRILSLREQREVFRVAGAQQLFLLAISDAVGGEAADTPPRSALHLMCVEDRSAGASAASPSVRLLRGNVATLSLFQRSAQSPHSLSITFSAHRMTPNSDCVVDIKVLSHILCCIAYCFGNTMTPTVATRAIRVTVSDGRNPSPGKAQVTLDVLPPFWGAKDGVVALSRQSPVIAVAVAVTRTKQPVDSFPILQRALLTLTNPMDVLTRGYLEIFTGCNAAPDDALQLRLSGSAFAHNSKGGALTVSKELVGMLYTKDKYIRLDFTLSCKASNNRRLQELLKMTYLQFSERGERDIFVLLSDMPTSSGSAVEHSLLRVRLSVS